MRKQAKKNNGRTDGNKLTPISMSSPESDEHKEEAKREGTRAEVQGTTELPSIQQNPMNISSAGAQWEIKTFRLWT